MRSMVILAVLFASLLVVTGAAFAASCCVSGGCAKVTGTDLTNPNNSFTQDWSFCDVGNNLVDVCNVSGPNFLFEISIFNQSLFVQAISINPVSAGVYMRFHGGDEIFNGLFYFGGDQYNIHGVAEPCPQ